MPLTVQPSCISTDNKTGFQALKPRKNMEGIWRPKNQQLLHLSRYLKEHRGKLYKYHKAITTWVAVAGFCSRIQLDPCLSYGYYCYGKTSWPKARWGEKDLFQLTFPLSTTQGSQGKRPWRMAACKLTWVPACSDCPFCCLVLPGFSVVRMLPKVFPGCKCTLCTKGFFLLIKEDWFILLNSVSVADAVNFQYTRFYDDIWV